MIIPINLTSIEKAKRPKISCLQVINGTKYWFNYRTNTVERKSWVSNYRKDGPRIIDINGDKYWD